MKHLDKQQSGLALVLVLWLMAFLTIMTVTYNSTMRTELKLSAQSIQISKARALSQGGIWFGVQQFFAQPEDRLWQGDMNPFTITIDGNEVEIQILDASGKLDLNTARPESFLNIFISTGLAPEVATQYTHAILDWKDKDNEKRPSGAEFNEYRAAGLDYGPKNGPFNSVEELQKVLGITDEVYQIISPGLTVHSLQQTINPNFAPKPALSAIPGIDVAEIDTIVKQRQAGRSTNRSTRPRQKNHLLRGSGNTYLIISTGKSANSRYTTQANILLKSNHDKPYTILSWIEAEPFSNEVQ